MEYFDFIKPGDLDELPEDSQLAFAKFVQLVQPRLMARLGELDGNGRDEWELIKEARYGFQNVVTGAAKRFRIEPFASSGIPLLANYNQEDYTQFRHDLSMYVTQIMLAAADQDRAGSVPILDKTRQSLRTYIFHLREAIDRTDLPDAKKAKLNGKLDDLERELERRRIRFIVVAGIIMTILAAPGELTSSYDAVVRLTNNIMREIGDAKATDDEQRHISHDEPVALLPPRQPQKPKVPSFASDEMDDEIPF